MAALVQTQTFSPPTMMPIRPSSAERYNSSSPYHHSQTFRPSQKYGSTSSTGYRGIQSTGPVAPYAFNATPQLGSALVQHRSLPTSPLLDPSTSHAPQLPALNLGGPSFLAQTSPKSLPPSPSASSPHTLSLPNLQSAAGPSASSSKSTPDRYRRTVRRTDNADLSLNKTTASAMPSGSGMAAVGSLYNHPTQSSSTPSLHANSSYRGTTYASTQPIKKVASDDMQLGHRQQSSQTSPDLASRYRRRSLGNIDTPGLIHHHSDTTDTSSPHPNQIIAPPNTDYMSVQHINTSTSTHKYNPSSTSASSSRSDHSSRPGSSRNEPMSISVQHRAPVQKTSVTRHDARIVNVSPRLSERRTPSGVSTPSPLSRPMNTESEANPEPMTRPQVPSPAAEQLAALNQKEAKKSKSKLRRAFSFGSAAELRKVTAQANLERETAAAASAASKRMSRHEEELDPESARIAAKQEAAGLGESIYSGQGNFFTGSTDNLSISSTASSASLMLRKMGKGMRKGGRSLVGLFRPKSVVGVPAADGPVNQASAAQVSMVTVEAEREKVNVNLDPHSHAGGGTGFPKLGRNSIDNKLSTDSMAVSTDTRSRRSIVGGERERAEVLAAVKKGILKRGDSNQSSPALRPMDGNKGDLTLPNIPHMTDTPQSSAPSTPKDGVFNLHKRSDSFGGKSDYFSSVEVTRYASLDSRTGAPITPNRNISFSPRIQFHDTWTSNEYDRRGEIATCNRLTPMLAQQIKEELNTFKMEMEVHESSKVYTHFF